MYIAPYTALDAAIAANETTKLVEPTCDERATVINLLSQSTNHKAAANHEADQIFILGYN